MINIACLNQECAFRTCLQKDNNGTEIFYFSFYYYSITADRLMMHPRECGNRRLRMYTTLKVLQSPAVLKKKRR